MNKKSFARSLIVTLIISLAFVHQGVQKAKAETTVIFYSPDHLQVVLDAGDLATANWNNCNGDWNTAGHVEGPYTWDIFDPKGFKNYYIHLYPSGGGRTEIENTDTGTCGGGTAEHSKASYCNNFYIPKRVPQTKAIPVSFKGPGNITSANIYFKDLGYSLSIWLYKYDWGNKTWYGYLNTTYLPLGKHHGHVTTFVDGVRGGGCSSGGFKVVDE